MLDHSAGALQGYPLKQRITAGTNMCVDSILCQPRCWLVDTHGLLHVLEKHVKTLLKASVALERLSEGCVARHACRYRAPFKRSQTLWPPSVPSQSGYFKFFAIRESIEASDFEKLNSEGAVSLMLRSLAMSCPYLQWQVPIWSEPRRRMQTFFRHQIFFAPLRDNQTANHA